MTLTDLARHYTRTYYRRVAVTAVLAIILSQVVWSSFGIQPTIGSFMNTAVLAAFIVARKPDELHRAHILVFTFGVGFVLPIAVLMNDFDTWLSFACAMSLAIIAMITCTWMTHRRKPQGVWLALPDGRDLPLDVRPFTCEECRRVHYAMFAQGTPIQLGDFDVARFELHAEKVPSGCTMVPLFTRDPEGTVWVPVAPPGFGITTIAKPGEFRLTSER